MRTWMWGIFEFGVACFEIYLMQLAIGLFLTEERRLKFKNLFIICAVLVNFCVNFWANEIVAVIPIKSIILCFTIAVIIKKGKLYWAALAAFTFYIIGGVCELASAAIITIPQKIAFTSTTTFDIQRLQTIIISEILMFIFLKTFTRLRKDRINEIPVKMFLLLIFLPFVSIIIIIQITLSAVIETVPQSFLMVISILCVAYINIIVFYIIEEIFRSAENEKLIGIMKAQLKAESEHIIRITETYSQNRQMRHDFRQYIIYWNILSDQKQYEKLSNELRELMDEQVKESPLANTGNPGIDAILSIKKGLAEHKNISCSWRVEIEPSLPIDELDMCAILGNALDNSIEACMRTRDARFINLVLAVNYEGGRKTLVCEIINPIGEVPKERGGLFKSSKDESGEHGFGLPSIRHHCEKLGGTVEILFNAEVFILRFLIKI